MGMDMSDLVRQVGEKLIQNEWMLVTAESCTGGMIGSVCTDMAGSSSWFYGGIISYANQAKQGWLDVQDATLDKYGAVSEQTVRQMCAGAVQSDGQVVIAVSGVAGPGGGSPEKPVGTVYIGWLIPGRKVEVERFQFDGERAQVRSDAVEAALRGVLNRIN